MSVEEDQYYKWGFFYYNKKDQRIFLPKRAWWLGITINFANPYSYLFIAGFIFIIGLIKHVFK